MARKPKATVRATPRAEPFASPHDHPETPGTPPTGQEIIDGLAESMALPKGDAHEPEQPHAERLKAFQFRRGQVGDAAVRLTENYQTKHSEVSFEFPIKGDRPSTAVRDILKGNGFRWEPEVTAWVKPIKYASRQQDRLQAEQAFDAVIGQLRQEAGEGMSR